MVNVTEFADYATNVTSGVEISDISVNTSAIFSDIWKSLPAPLLAKWYLIADISVYILIAVLVYFIIKIIYQLFKFRDGKNIAVIAEQTREINTKLDELLHKKTDKRG